MARMIPAFFDESTSPGEQEVFNMLSNGPTNWVVFHSLDLSPWNNNRRTEVDFVILIPDIGILCVEVKSQKKITFENDRWYPTEIRRSPFKQAQDGSKAFYRGLRRLEPRFSNFPVAHLCIFTRSDFHIRKVISVSVWELIDARVFRQFQNSADFCAEIVNRLRTAIEEDPVLRPSIHPLSPSHIELIINLCIPVQMHKPDARAEIEHRVIEMDKLLRDQQKPVLRLVEQNKAIVVSGAAGTGKTLIAMEVALRAANDGKRVGLLCFNRLVGDWMKLRVKDISLSLPNLVVGRVFQVLADMCRIEIPSQPPQEYWDRILPELMEEKLTNPDFKMSAIFDCLIIDESQDLLSRPRLWESMLQFLDGGVKDGTIVLFGDFEHQVLGQKKTMVATLENFYDDAKPARYRLDENCRNYEIVGNTAIKLTGFRDDVYASYLRTGGSAENYKIQFYVDMEDQLVHLKKMIVDFIGRGYQPSEITVLSFCSASKSVAAELSKVDRHLRPAGTSSTHATYSSIAAFKGLENKIIILTDVQLDDREFSRDLFYTGMTRCTETVFVLCAVDAQTTLAKWLAEVNDT